MAGTDFTRLTKDELINGIKATKLPDYFRTKYHGGDVRETFAQLSELVIQLGINMGLSPEESLKWARKLQDSVSQSEFDSWVSTLLDGGPTIFMNTLSELQTTYPNGASGVALVRETDPAKIYVWNGSAWEDFGNYQGVEVKDGSVTTTKLADEAITSGKLARNSVTHDKTDFIIGGEPGKNLFDKSKAVMGYRLDSLDGVTPVVDPGFAYVENIPVMKNSDLFRSHLGGLFVFDENRNLLKKFNNGDGDIAFNSGSGTTVSFNMRIYAVDSVMLEYGSSGTTYEPYVEPLMELDPGVKVSVESLDKSKLKDLYTAGTGIVIENGVISNVLNTEKLSNQYCQVVSNNAFRIFQRLGEGTYVGYLYQAGTIENYIRMMDISIFELNEGVETGKPYEVLSGNMTSTSTVNHYTTEVGTKVGVSFKGTSVALTHLTRTDGGVWGVTIDGVEYPPISTWYHSIIVKTTMIADDLSNSNHDVVLEFLGADPNNSPKDYVTGDTVAPRGWLTAPDTFTVVETGQGSFHFSDKGLIADSKSNKDFAITVAPKDISGDAQFFPLHSGNDTTKVVEKYLTIDGHVIDLSKPTDILPFESGAFLEKLECKLTYDTGIRARGSILWTFDNNRIGQEFELEFLKPSTLNNGYIFMLPIPYSIIDRVKTNRREETYRDSEVIGTPTYFNDLEADSFRVTYNGDYKEFYLEAGMTNHSHGLSRLWLQRRDTSLFKLYPQQFLNNEVLAGDKIFFDGYFRVGKIKGINI